MNADELRELADALSIPTAYTYGPTDPQRQKISAYLRACADALEKGPVATTRVHRTGGNAGIAWSAVPTDSGVLMKDGTPLYPVALPAQPSSNPCQLPEPMTDAAIIGLWRSLPKNSMLVRDGSTTTRLARAIEAETLRRVKECNE